MNLAFAPYRLPTDPDMTRALQVGEEFSQFPFVLRFPYESAKGVCLARVAASSFQSDLLYRAASHANQRGALGEGSEVQIERPVPVQFANRRDSISNALQ